MSVAELVEYLRKADQNARVFVALHDGTWRTIETTVNRWDDSCVLIMTHPPSVAPSTQAQRGD